MFTKDEIKKLMKSKILIIKMKSESGKKLIYTIKGKKRIKDYLNGWE